ncbi:MAG: MCE family protein [Bdellovibrionaceae bacterium]|nr:MCE family protein [Pseudobdellovibrionaceae bacterium]MBX3034626.1 MCE family protein [Pseudobdellovibrionaceae bacterium]
MNGNLDKKIERLKAGWAIWLFPAFAILITAWLFWDYYNQRGPEIKIFFDDASAIQPEKTRLRFRGVTIGVVKNTTISPDGKHVIAHALLQRDARHFAVEGSKFWLVMPKVNFQGVSGLETLFEGTYIAVQPGPAGGPHRNLFQGLTGGDSSEALDDAIPFYLETPNVGSVSPGDRITFRGMVVGSVTKLNLSKTSQTIIVQINIQKKFLKLIRTNSVFWRKVAVQAKFGLFNSELKIGSLDSILHGGIDLFTPDNPGEIAKGHSVFTLHDAPPKGSEKWNPKLEYSASP